MVQGQSQRITTTGLLSNLPAWGSCDVLNKRMAMVPSEIIWLQEPLQSKEKHREGKHGSQTEDSEAIPNVWKEGRKVYNTPGSQQG